MVVLLPSILDGVDDGLQFVPSPEGRGVLRERDRDLVEIPALREVSLERFSVGRGAAVADGLDLAIR